MVVAANMAFAQIKNFKPKEEKKEYKVYKKTEDIKPEVIIKEKIVEVKKKPKPKKEIKNPLGPKNTYNSPWGSPGGSKR